MPTNVLGLRRVKRWLHLENISIYEEAVCDAVGIEAIHIPVFNGTYRDGALAVLEGSKQSFDNVGYHVETVCTNTIDAFVAAHGISFVDFIKVDTEGAEDRVIKGAMRTISHSLPSLYLETLPDQPWLNSLYNRGYHSFYSDGMKLYSAHRGAAINILLVHDSKLSQISDLL